MNNIINFSKKENQVCLGLLFIFILNILSYFFYELTFDEAYYWMYSQNLSWGYFDHPPMIAIFIKIGTLIFGQNEFAVRILSNIAFAGGCLVLWRMTKKENVLNFLGLSVVFLLVHFNGLFAVPDAALFFFTILYFYFLKKYLLEDSFLNAFILGIIIACLFYSKYQGLLIIILTLFAVPRLIIRKTFWVVFITSLFAYLPHLVWQYNHDWISFKYHLTGRKEKHFDIANITSFILGQIVLLGFVVFGYITSQIKKIEKANEFNRILLFNTFGFLLFLFILSFRNPIEANWSTSIAIAMIILFTDRLEWKKLKFCIIPSLLLVMTFRIVLFFPFEVRNELNLKVNRLFEVSGWKNNLIPGIKYLCGKEKMMADNYQHASKLSFYLKENIPALHINSRRSHYSLLNQEKKDLNLERVCYINTKKMNSSAIKIETGLPDNIFVHKTIDLSNKELK